ncbi:MAG: hypothetical protein HUJ90_01210, partial [Bacteroidales bacterium]|nr:hypothetical protein [Bacteroidales bacterium]
FNFNFTWRFNFPHKVNIFRVTELDNRPLFDIVMTMDTYIAGGCMVAPGNLWAEFWQRLRQSAITMAACGLADDDQNVVLLTYRRYPDLFAVHPSGFFSQIQQYNDTGTEWSEKSSSSPMHKRLLDKLRAKLRRIRFAFRVYRYINHL